MTQQNITIDIEASDAQAGMIVLTLTVGTYAIPIPLDRQAAGVFAHKMATAYATAFGDIMPPELQKGMAQAIVDLATALQPEGN